MEPSNHARFDIDGQGQPGAPDRLPILATHDDHIHQGVVDLYQVQGLLGLKGRGAQRPELLAGLFRSIATVQHCVGIERFHAPPYRAVIGRLQRTLCKPPANFQVQNRDRGTLRPEIEPIDAGIEESFPFLTEQEPIRLAPALPRQQ